MRLITHCFLILLFVNGCREPVADPKPEAIFEVRNGVGPGLIEFINSSTHATEYSWKFGDGQTSTYPQPTIVYTRNGTYQVSLTAKRPGSETTLTKTILITTASLTGGVVFWPNHEAGVVDVYVNDKLMGTITKYMPTGRAPDCGAEGFVTATLPEGSYTFTAQTREPIPTKWSGSITVVGGQCQSRQLAQ